MRFCRLPFALAATLSVLILFMPASGVPTAPPGTDKLIHVALFAALALTGRFAAIPVFALLLGLIAYAGVSEVLQGLLPIGRTADLFDAGVDVLGICLGVAISQLIARGSTRTRDKQRKTATIEDCKN